MNRIRRSLALVLMIAALLSVHPLPGAAQTTEPAAGSPGDGEFTAETWMGALAGVGCGLFIRATVATAGTQAGTWAGAIACCGFMIFDALVIDPALNH